jgi:hypothetical protein
VAKKTNQVQVEKAKAEEKSFARHDGRNITCNDLLMSRKIQD